MSDFNWPCPRREAHGPHRPKRTNELGHTYQFDCPGVRAHPNTMIGRPASSQLSDPQTWNLAISKLVPLENEERWPETLDYRIPLSKLGLVHEGILVDFYAPIGEDGENIYRTYQVIELSKDLAVLKRVDNRD